MKRISDKDLARHFLGWQCRIRQIAMRDFGGRPLPGMQPVVLTRQGDAVLDAMTVLIVPLEPASCTAFLRFQVQKTFEPQRAYATGLSYLAAEFYQQPELFNDELTAQFAPASSVGHRLVRLRTVLLEFEQYSQRYRMFCRVRELKGQDPAREATLWHNRLFNPNIPNDATVLGFKPDWKSAVADPMP